MLKIAWRYTFSDKRNLRVSVLGIAFSVMLMFSLMQMGDCIIERYMDMVSSGMKRDFTVYNISYEQIAEVEEILEDRFHAEGIMSFLYAGTYWENDVRGMDIFGLRGDIAYFKDTGLLEGRYPQEPDDICLEVGYSESKPETYHVGDTIDITVRDAESKKEVQRQFQVCGIMKNVASDGYHLWISMDTANEIREGFGDKDMRSNSVAAVMKKSARDSDRIAEVMAFLSESVDVSDNTSYRGEAYKTNMAKFYTENWLDNDGKIALYDDKGSYTSTSLTFKALAVILATCMVIFIFNTYNIGIIRKIRQLAAMRCVGVSRKQMVRIVLYEALTAAHIGTAIGLVLGNALNYLAAGRIMNALMSAYDSAGTFTVRQTWLSYLETYLLVLASVLLGIWKILHDVGKLTISEMLNYAEKSRFRLKGVNVAGKPHLRWQLVERNLKRNASKNASLMATMMVSLLLSLVIFSVFASVDIRQERRPGTEFRYSIWSDILSQEKYIPQEAADRLGSLVGTENLYKLCSARTWDGKITTAEGKEENIFPVIYDDALFGKLLESYGIEGIDCQNEPYALLYSENGEAESIDFSNAYDREKAVVPISGKVSGGNPYTDGEAAATVSYVLMNEKMAETSGIYTEGWSRLYIGKSPETATIPVPEILACFNGESGVVLDNYGDSQDRAKQQLLGMVALAAYIMAAAVLLTGIIISNTIQANLISRMKEIGVMRALGTTRKRNIESACMENGVLFAAAYLSAVLLSILVNLILGAQLDDGIRFSPVVYIGTAVLFCAMVEGITVKHMKSGLRNATAEMLRDE